MSDSYEFVKEMYDCGSMTAQEVQDMVPFWITQEEADTIIGGGAGA